MTNARLTNIAHATWSQILRPGDTVVDATCGNGHDTLFLAESVGSEGQTFAFDLQESATTTTRAAIESTIPSDARPTMHYLTECHSKLQEIVGSNTARLVCFNLGYLPGGDKNVITTQESTLAAVEAAFEVLRPGGLLSILSYTGHPGGMEEYAAVSALLEELPPQYWVSSQIKLLNRPTAPVLLLALKREIQAEKGK